MKYFFLFLSAWTVCLAVIPAPAIGLDSLPVCELTVTLDPERGRLTGEAIIQAGSNDTTVVSLGSIRPQTVVINGEASADTGVGSEMISLSPGDKLTVAYDTGMSAAAATADAGHHRLPAGNIISSDGVSLVQGWYPAIDGAAYYKLTVTVPQGFVAVSEADQVNETPISDGTVYAFHFPYPLEAVHLAADRYQVYADHQNGVDILAYFSQAGKGAAERYLAYAQHYLDLYTTLIGPYPYKRFAVVENILPTGYAVPTFTLLGRAVIKLPFIAKTSLGHEILHQWFGNSVWVDYESGNWCEGLTTYLADHLYEDRQGRGAIHRKKILVDYQSYIAPDLQIPLRSFTKRMDRQTKATGYGKGAMVFHMLKDEIGASAFYQGVQHLAVSRKFMKTSWKDLQEEFEAVSGKNLSRFFNQWLDRSDIPVFNIENSRLHYEKGQPILAFDIAQSMVGDPEPFYAKVKIELIYGNNTILKNIQVENRINHVAIEVPPEVEAFVLDPDYDLMRGMGEKEYPAVLSRFMGDEDRAVIIDAAERDRYGDLVTMMERQGVAVLPDDTVTDDMIRRKALLLVGGNRTHRRLFGTDPGTVGGLTGEPGAEDGFSLTVRSHPLNRDKVVVVVLAANKEEVAAAVSKIPHYGNYSQLIFRRGTIVRKTLADSQQGVRQGIAHRVYGVVPEKMLSLDTIIDRIIDEPVIYVGESHNRYEDHRVQLEIIRRLHTANQRFAIGMEMFQRPFQKGLDDYLGGTIDERQFLKATEYFGRWRFDYQLYREIVNYAKANSIPILALNIDGEITRKVARGGLDALTAAEKETIPADMDMSDPAYTDRLRTVFSQHQHGNFQGGDFYHFYQAQVLWDETMAHTISDFLATHPDSQMVVLAGGGHLAYGAGIPNRVERLTGTSGVILLNSGSVDGADRTVADYVLFPEGLSPPPVPKLGVMIENDEEGIAVKAVRAGSPADKAGVEEGDVITRINDFNVERVEDIHIAMIDRQAGDRLVLTVLRNSFFLGVREETITLLLP